MEFQGVNQSLRRYFPGGFYEMNTFGWVILGVLVLACALILVKVYERYSR
jgi:hypothetical protein